MAPRNSTSEAQNGGTPCYIKAGGDFECLGVERRPSLSTGDAVIWAFHGEIGNASLGAE